jgi:hypothetical protein
MRTIYYAIMLQPPLQPVKNSGGPESFHWVGIQYRNNAPQYVTVLATVLRYLGRRKSRVVLSLPRTQLDPPLVKKERGARTETEHISQTN